ncbi:MAG: hypothetical protein PVH03_01450 [Chloroflexota bacterium]|jgi:hypothetical protein
MSVNISIASTQKIGTSPDSSVIQQHVKDILEDAIKYAISKLPAASQDEELQTLSQRHDFLCYLKCGLAKGVGDLLTQYDEQIKEVYLFEPDANPDLESSISDNGNLDATVHLLLLVGTPSAALESLITALDRALTQGLKDLEIPVYAEYRSVLDIVPITDEDVRMRRGFAVLLTSIFTPPIRIC